MDPDSPPPRLVSLSAGADNHENWKTMWEIGTPEKNSLYWSIFMAYLTTPGIPDVSVIGQSRLKIIGDLADDSETQGIGKKLNLSLNYIDEATLGQRLQNFNPFINRHMFYSDTNMEEILQLFMWRLNLFSNRMESSIPQGDERCLEAASQMLACTIEVYCVINENERCASFRKNNFGASVDQIILFEHETDKTFRFGMSTKSANPLRKIALSSILTKARITIDQDIQNEFVENNEMFLLSVLKCKEAENIVELYRSPYIALILSEAGFETNPLAVDSDGLSAFCHSLKTENAKLYGTLYNSAINSCLLSGSCIRNPNKCVVESLQLMKATLKKDRIVTRNFKDWSSMSKKIFDAYTRFNKFQLKFVQQRIALEKENNFTFRRDSTLVLINCYEEFSNVFDLSNNDTNFQNYFNEYKQHKMYYQMLETFTCILFFDSLHNLLENIPLQNPTVYYEINQNFLMLTLCNNNVSISETSASLIYKKDLESNFCELSKELKNIPVPPKRAEKSEIDEFYRKNLADIPAIKDEVIISKVKSYLEACLQLMQPEDFTTGEAMKRILATQRTIQILGECLKPSATQKCIASYLLCSCLPYGWEDIFINIRNFLSHFKGNDIQIRLALERNLGLCLEIKEQVLFINEKFQTVYLFQTERTKKFLVKSGLEKSKTFASSETNADYQMQYNQLHHVKPTTDFIPSLNIYLVYLKSSLESNSETCEKFYDKLFVLYDLIEIIFEDDRRIQSFSKNVYECQKILSFQIVQSKNKENSNSSKEKKHKISSKNKNKLQNNLCILEQICPQKLNVSTSFRCAVGECFDSSINHRNFSEEEMQLIITLAKQIYDKTKEDLENRIGSGEMEETELKEKLRSFIFDQQKIKKKKLIKKWNRMDAEKRQEGIGTCCFSWDKFKSKLEDFLEKNISEHRESRILILKVCYSVSALKQNLKVKLFDIINQKMNFLLKRIEYIKQILVAENEEICQDFRRGNSAGLKHHTKFLMTQRYVKEIEVRASLEMVLFDCYNLMRRKDLKDLWLKTENLLAGINIRDVLSHGNVVLDTIGVMLDPTDMPTALVGKMIELVEDAIFISEMVGLHTLDAGYERMEAFKSAVKKKGLFNDCPRLESYLDLMPFG